MIRLDDLMAFLNATMGDTQAAAQIDPHMANGLQVRGRDEVHILVTGVSASLRFFEEARALGADALLVHHSINMPASIHFDPIFSRRLRYLWEHDLSLIGYHYLLDSHAEVGNNAQIIKALGGQLVEPYPPDGWGWVAEIEGGERRDFLLARCTELFSQEGVHYPFGPERVRRMVVVSGGGAPGPAQMAWLMAHQIDLYITGEPREWSRELFREAGISFVAAGHYFTERVGVQALGDLLQRRLELDVKFLDLPNPV
ncbi:MAG: type 2 GTP cyclohydrolase I [Anaerolineae bacterium]